MEEESPETLVKFVKTMTSSVQSVLQSPNTCRRSVTQQNYTRRRRLKKKSQNTIKSSKKQQQYLAQQYSIQHMYSTSILNAAPVCFGDKRNTLLGLEPPPQQFSLDGTGSEIETCRQFLTDYIPTIGSPRENRMQSYDIYSARNNLQYARSTCMYDNQQSYHVDFETPQSIICMSDLEVTCTTRNAIQHTCTNEWSDIIISPECDHRSEQLSHSYDDDDSLDDTLGEIFNEIEQNSLSFTDVSPSIDSVYSADGELSDAVFSLHDSLSCDSDDSAYSVTSATFSSPPPSTKSFTVLPSFSSIFM